MATSSSADVRRPGAAARGRLRALAIVPALLLLALFSAAKCYPPGTRVIVFLQGVYTTYDATGTQWSPVEAHRFQTLKAAFADKGYAPSALLDFSYAGGSVGTDGAWQPAPYSCEQTDRTAAANLAPLETMLRDYRARHPDAHFALVGHSLGGYLAFLEGARDAARPAAEKLGVDVVVTVDAPLLGVSPDKKWVIDLLPCTKTYLAGAELVAQREDAATPAVRRYQAAVMAQQGVRLATLGNGFDCLYNTQHCIGGTWIDDSATQILPGEAAFSREYWLNVSPFASHEQTLADPGAVHDAVTFVGAP